MGQTYRAAHDKRANLIRHWIYDEGAWTVWVDPSPGAMGGPVLIICGHMDQPQDLAEKIAALLTEAQL
jgi:hypothetical protein